MTISSFANARRADSWDTIGTPIRRAYREHKRREAEQRQSAHAALWGHIVGSWPRTDPARDGRKKREGLA